MSLSFEDEEIFIDNVCKDNLFVFVPKDYEFIYDDLEVPKELHRDIDQM